MTVTETTEAAPSKADVIAKMLALPSAEDSGDAPEPDAPAAEAPAAEPPAADKTPEEKAKSAEWKKVRERERAVREREQQLSRREQEMLAEVRAKLSVAERAQALLAEGKPLDAIDALGIDRSKLLAQLEKLAEGHDPKVEALLEQQRELNRKLAEKEAREREAAQQQEMSAREQKALSQVRGVLSASTDPLIKAAIEHVGDRYVNAVYRELRAAAAQVDLSEWDDATQLTAAHERVMGHVRREYELMQRVFSGGPGPAPVVAGSPRQRSGSKPQTTTQDGPPKPLTPRQAFARGMMLAKEVAGKG